MDFVAVPAGTTPDQALKIRGSDHDLELATADPFITVLGTTQHDQLLVNQWCPTRRYRASYGPLLYRDPLVLNAALHGRGIVPTKLRALWLHQVANGSSNAHALALNGTTIPRGDHCRIDPANLPPE